MNRRNFVISSGAAAAALTSTSKPAPAAPKKALMRLGCQSAPTTEAHVKYFARYGVRDITGYPQIDGDRLYATVDELKRMKDMAAANGVSVEGIAAPFLTSSHV